jgi:dipeptidyl aminopeptidase/acylaminoacyl peptidase
LIYGRGIKFFRAIIRYWADQYNLSDMNSFLGEVALGSPWKGNNMEKYKANSSITTAKNIKATTLIIANIGDPRVPITQSYKLYHALKDWN